MTDIVEKTDFELLIEAAEKEMLELPQVECPVVNRLENGIYIRECLIPAGTLAIGHEHIYDHITMIPKGKMTLLNDDGSTFLVDRPTILNSKPGRKVGLAHEDTVIINIYATNAKDVESFEKDHIRKSIAWEKRNKKCLGSQPQ